jgi:putative DNA primase/helicase
VASADELAELRLALCRNGYAPVPISGAHLDIDSAGKRPQMKNWETVCATADEAEIRRWSQTYRQSTNTGILCGEIVAIDIDVRDPAIAAELETLAQDMLGTTRLKRIGENPKCALCYRTLQPFRKIQTDEFYFPERGRARVEVLASGQQFVGFGIHPGTMAAYYWPDKMPLDVPASDLPVVDADRIREFIERAEQILQHAGGLARKDLDAQERKGRKAARLNRDENPPIEVIEDALTFFPNNDLAYDLWIRIGMSLYAGAAESGRSLWERWSAHSAKNNPELTSQKYNTFSGTHSITIGTLFYHAMENGWRRKRKRFKNAQGAGCVDGDARPTIRIWGGNLPRELDQAEDALISAQLELFQRGGMMVRPALVPVEVADGREVRVQALVPLTTVHMQELMTRAAHWEKYLKSYAEWVPINCPKATAEAFLGREGEWNLPVLTGLINRPTLRRDGSLLSQPGYDKMTGLFFDPQGWTFDPIPVSPSRVDALAALEDLAELFQEVPFETEADRAVALSGLLTPLIRYALPSAPLHAFTSPAAGTGKSMLVDIMGIIATGHEVAVMSQGNSKEEDEKRLDAALVQGFQLISVDNCDVPLEGARLCQALTQQSLSVRILGQTKQVEASTRVTFYATGNNLQISGDLTRRCLCCLIDAKIERPELRQFANKPKVSALKNRGRYVVAGLTILLAYHLAGYPSPPRPLASFEEWSDRVRGALIWLGCADPCVTMERIRVSDPKLEAEIILVEQWRDVVRKERLTTRELCDFAMEATPEDNKLHPALYDCLQAIAGESGGICTRRLGKALGRCAGRIISGMKITKDCKSTGDQTWRLEQLVTKNRTPV